MRIRNNVASLNSLRHSAKNVENVKTSIEKLSSGVKINHAADGPASLIASERLRGNIAGLKQSHSNNSIAVSLLQTTEGSLNEVSSLLVRMKQLSVHAANEAVNDDAMLAADQQEIENLLTSLDRIVENTSFNGKKLLDGSMGANGSAVGDNIRFVDAETGTKASPKEGYKVDITQVATRSQKKGETPLSVNNIGNGIFMLVNESGRNAELNTKVGPVKEDIDKIVSSYKQDPERFTEEQMSSDIRGIVVHHMQKALDQNGINVDIFIGPDQTFTLRHKEFGEDPSFSVTSNITGVVTKEANIAELADPGVDIAGTIDGSTARGKGQFLTALEGASPAQGITIQYDREIDMKEVPIKDESGVTIGTRFVEETQDEVVGSPSSPKLEGYIHLSQQTKQINLGPNSGQESSISLKNIRSNKLSQGVSNESGFRSLADIDLTNLDAAKDSSNLIDSAIDEISTYRAKLGSFQKNTVESNLNSLKVAEENLTMGESMIRDTDMAEEMSKLTSDQILMSASQSMLAQANQLPQNVISLLEQ